jgi:hypothetical protein
VRVKRKVKKSCRECRQRKGERTAGFERKGKRRMRERRRSEREGNVGSC